MYINPSCDHGISSRCLGLHRTLFDFSRVLSTSQSFFVISVSQWCAPAGCQHSMPLPLLHQVGKWEHPACKDKEFGNAWLSDQGRSMPSYVKELRSLCTFPGLYAALPPLAEFAIDFSNKAKLTLVPHGFPAKLERKAGLLQNQNVFSEEMHSPRDL